jgi:hypothetical protein
MSGDMQLFCDMDGVLADFDTGYEQQLGRRPSKAKDNVDWAKVKMTPNFYLNLPPMIDMPVLWKHIRDHKPVILTGIPSDVPEAFENKRAWVSRWLGTEVSMIGCRSAEKSQYARPGDILVDDWEKYRDKWIEAGGIWITHYSAFETISQLRAVGIS